MNDTIYLGDFKIEVTRKRIKNLHIHIKPPYGEVTVTAPVRMPQREIKRFVEEKEQWIFDNVSKMQASAERVTPEPEYTDGETISVWGDIYTLQVCEGTRYSLELEDNEYGEHIATFHVRAGSSREQRSDFILEWYRHELIERVEVLMPQWELFTGLHCSSWQSKNMKTRWGSCNTKTKKIWLNVQLAKYPVECLEYVILHELAHTVVPNHGPEFKAILSKYMPEWKNVKKRLRSV